MHEEGWSYFGDEEPLARRLWNAFTDAKTLGSLVPVDLTLDELAKLRNRLADMDAASTMGSLSTQAYIGQILDTFELLVEFAEILTQKYDVVITNPPYMGSSNMDKTLSDFVKKQYPDSKSDLFACFLEKCIAMTAENRYCTLVTMHSWMFLSSFENLRKNILKSQTIININHLGMEAFENIIGKVVSTTSFVLFNAAIPEYKLRGVRLVDYYDSKRHLKPSMFFNEENRYTACQSNFSKIPGSPVAYWVSESFYDAFSKGISVSKISDYTGSQNKTANNEKYLRFHWEIDGEKIGKNNNWIFYSKGGEYRKHYGNLELVIDWSLTARSFYKNNSTSNLLDEKYWFQEGITYTMLTSKGANFRYMPSCGVFDMGGPEICYLGNNLYYVLAFLNSCISRLYLNLLNPTINLQAKDIKSLPLIVNDQLFNKISTTEEQCVALSREDWNSLETSWEFRCHPLI